MCAIGNFDRYCQVTFRVFTHHQCVKIGVAIVGPVAETTDGLRNFLFPPVTARGRATRDSAGGRVNP